MQSIRHTPLARIGEALVLQSGGGMTKGLGVGKPGVYKCLGRR